MKWQAEGGTVGTGGCRWTDGWMGLFWGWQWLTIITHLLLLPSAIVLVKMLVWEESPDDDDEEEDDDDNDDRNRRCLVADGCEFNKAPINTIHMWVGVQRPPWQQPSISIHLLMCNNYFQLLPIKCCIQSMFICSRGDLIMRLPLSLRVTRPQWLGGLGSIGPFRGVRRCLRAM